MFVCMSACVTAHAGMFRCVQSSAEIPLHILRPTSTYES